MWRSVEYLLLDMIQVNRRAGSVPPSQDPKAMCVSAAVTLTYDGGEASCGFIPCDQLVELRVVKLQTFQKCHISSLSFSVEDVE